ncbi:MAG: TlpA family protein disulfide reductase [Deltaproteobacteria bacterium]|nr:TlpA family protein disulfide reductase [Deltaproteobacteria bacterium]
MRSVKDMEDKDRAQAADGKTRVLHWLQKRFWDLMIILVILFIAKTLFWERAPKVGEGDQVPDMILQPINSSRSISLRHRKNRSLFLVFWATWCPACRSELPALQKIYRAYSGDGLDVLAVSSEVGKDENVKMFLAGNGYTFPVALDSGRLMRAFGVTTIPALFLVGKDGRVTWYEVGTAGEHKIAEEVEKTFNAGRKDRSPSGG